MTEILNAHPLVAGIVIVVVSYLLGSISSAILVCRLMGLPDPREGGSGNPGATNVLRTGSRPAALLTLVGDVAKGLAPVMALRLLGAPDGLVGASGVAAVAGHIYPVFFGFRGGKGVATLAGVLFGMSPAVGAAWLANWLLVAGLFRYSSLAALVATALAPLFAHWLLGSAALTVATGILALAIVWRHRSNVRNLLDGSESRIGRRA